MSSHSAKLARRMGPHCYWCRRKTVPAAKSNPANPLGATVDHVRSRPECLTKREYIEKKNKVLACYECNQRRSKEWSAKFQAGQVFRTEFAEHENAKWKARRKKFEAIKEHARLKQLAENEARRCTPIKMVVLPELSEAWDN